MITQMILATHSDWSPVLHKVYEFLLFISTPVIYILIGLGANLTEHYRKGTLNKKQAVISTILGFLTGFITYKTCIALGFQSHMGYAVPIATMAGEKLIPYIIESLPKALKKFVDKKIGSDE